MVFQDYALFPHMTVADNVAFGLNGYEGQARRRRVLEALDHARMAHLAGRYPHQLSGGEQQRVALARSVASRPLVLLLDEPLSNLDPSLRLYFRRDLKRVIKSTGIPAIYVTHDQQEALFMGDQVTVMNRGQLEQTGTPHEVFERPASRFVASFLGPAAFVKAQATPEGLLTEMGLLRQPVEREAVGKSVEVLLRPDDLALTPNPEGSCQVVEYQFLGTHTACTVRLPSGQLVQVLQPHGQFVHEGDRVSLRLDPGHALCCFPPGEEPGSLPGPA
jgi:iron(III) transport system ATP-binding protein